MDIPCNSLPCFTNNTCVHECGIFNVLIDALVRKLCMKMLKFIGLIRALQPKLVHTSLVFLVCHDLTLANRSNGSQLERKNIIHDKNIRVIRVVKGISRSLNG